MNALRTEVLDTQQGGTQVLPLENGDRLSRHEFERRYTAMPRKSHAAITAWLSDYWIATPGTDLSDNTTVRLDLDNKPQPDAYCE